MGVRCFKIVLLSTSVIVSIIALAISFLYAGIPSTFTKSLTPHNYNNAPTVHLDPLRGVEVEISPSFQNANPGTTLTYIGQITNTGDIEETYYSIVTDNLGWELAFGIKQVTISPLDWVFTTLKVTIPENALGSTQDIITITMTSLDNAVSDNASCATQASTIKGVSLEISPAENFGFPEDEVTFFIIVRNTGNVYDNFDLNANDNSGWALTLDNTVLDGIPPGEDEQTVLRVTIPENAAANSKDNITVVAVSKTDPTISDNKSCIVNVMQATRGVSISISPSENEEYPGDVITFIVSVNNTGNAKDNFDLTVSDNSGWSPNVSPTSLVLAAFSGGNATLSVTIPPDATGGTVDNIRVTATSRHDNTKSDDKTVTANVILVRGVSVSISPSSQNGANGATLTYTVTVNNTGNASDTFSLTYTDNAGWSPSVLPTSLTLSPGSSDNATLSVTIPSNAVGGTIDNITVTATGDVSGSGSCTAEVAIAKGVTVSISPSSKSGANGATLTYNVTVTNTGNVSDTYTLENTDTLSWTKSLSNTSVGPLSPSAFDNSTTLSVIIPSNAIGGTIDNITVTATSQTDNTVSDSDSCTVEVTVTRGVSVSISPNYENGENGATLTYTVTVINTGNVTDNYGLTVIDNAGWGPTVSPTPLTIIRGGNGNATLTVIVPPNAIPDTMDSITVTATSQSDNNFRDNTVCTAQAVAAVSPPPTPPPPAPQPNPSPSNTDNTPPPTPSLISPPNGATITDNTPTLDWSDVSDPSGVAYNLSMAKDAGFTLIVLLKNGLKVSTYDLTPSEVLAAGTYYWRVRAVDNAGNASSWSENWSFTASPGSHPPPPTPANFTVSDLTISPTEVTLGEEVSISVKVKNTGDLGGTYTAILKINGVVENIENVPIIGGSTKTVKFTMTKEVKGTYHVEVDGLTGEFAVLDQPIGLALPILIILLIAMIAIVAMVMKKKRKKPQRSKTR